MTVISKQLVCQKYIYKIHSSRLRKERWKLSLPIEEARRNDEVISLADSQVLRWIDELNGITDADEQARKIKQEIRRVRKEPNSIQNKRVIKQLYTNLDKLQYKPDYMCLIIDKEKDYYRACKGFSINGVKYKRLLGTNGGIKNSTIVFVSERLVDELRRRIDNGRNPEAQLVPAKLEAYKALTCSASTPVSLPKGILVVNDCETEFLSDIVYLTPEFSLQKRFRNLVTDSSCTIFLQISRLSINTFPSGWKRWQWSPSSPKPHPIQDPTLWWWWWGLLLQNFSQDLMKHSPESRLLIIELRHFSSKISCCFTMFTSS